MLATSTRLLTAAAAFLLMNCAEGCYDPDFDYGYTRASNYAYRGRYPRGTVLSFYCYNDYYLKGRSSVRCGYRGWDGDVPKCVKGCMPPRYGDYYHEKYDKEMYDEGDKMYYKCAKGYYAPKDMKYTMATCHKDGNWDNKPYKCHKYCDHPKTFFRGEFHPDKPYYKYDDKVYYRCPRYYNKYIYSSCGKDGEWKQASKCHDYCKMPKMDHGYHEPKKDKYYYGDTVKYYCNDKYSMHYDGDKYEMAKCGEDGYWDKKHPMCKKYCEAPDYKMYHHRQYRQSSYKHGEKIYFYCKENHYRPMKYRYGYATCMDGKWDNAPYKCEKRCTAHDYSNYYHKPYDKDVYSYGEKMMYKCKDGYYKPDGHDYDGAKCGSDGEWDKKPYKCMKYCKMMDMKYGGYRPKKDMYKYGDKMYYSCHDGYTLYYKEEKYDYNECGKGGKFKYMHPVCKKYCDAPEIYYGYYMPKKKYYNVGDRLEYGCDDGYNLYYGDVWYQYNECKDNGKWRYKEPSCRKREAEYCEAPHHEHGGYRPMKSRYSYGDKLYYSCKEGYKLHYEDERYDYIKCMKGGKWDKKPPMCKKKETRYCKAPYIEHGYYEPMRKMYDYMERVYYKCKEGYRLYYDEDWYEYATCGKDGVFDYKPPKCISMKKKYCMPDDFMHGDYYPKMKTYEAGDRMYYRCHRGYKIHYRDDRYEYRTCGGDGYWDNDAPTCRKVFRYGRYCETPDIYHGSLRPMKYAYGYGDKVYFDCDDGYMKYYDGDEHEYSTCKSDGMWDHPPPKCKSKYKNYCMAPRITHGSYYPKMKMYGYGDRLRYKCDKGYEKHYDGDRYEYSTCGKDGYWDKDPPKCKDMKKYYCTHKKVEHGMYKPMRKVYNPGDHVYYSCKEGYKLYYLEEWYEKNICDDDGMWKYKAPECRMANKAYCDTPKFNHGTMKPYKRSYAYGEKLNYECHDGYELYYMDDSYEHNMCKTGGYWQYKHPMCKKSMEKYCYPPDHHHGSYYPVMRKYGEGERMYYKCDRGYMMVYHDMDYEYNTCKGGKWEKKAPKCMNMRKKYCMGPKMDHGKYEPKKRMYTHGEKITYKCDDGYYKDYDGDYYRHSTCKEDGKWDRKPPMCKKHDTGYCMPKPMKHGDYYPKKDRYSYGDRIAYRCGSGYRMEYRTNRFEYMRCGRNGKWDQDRPMCMGLDKKYCPAPKVDHSDYYPKEKYYEYGDKVFFNCHSGYYKYYSGRYETYSTCGKDGKWDKLPECKGMTKKYCMAPKHSDYYHKSYAKRYYMPGEYITFYCDDGYYAPGDKKYAYATCKSDGKWDKAPYKCKKYCMADDMKYGYYQPMKKYYKHGDKISYWCNKGYDMKYHDSNRYDYMTCGSDGYWDKKAPKCMKYCYGPQRFNYGSYAPSKRQYEYGEKITFQCYRGYRLIGRSSYVECGHHGRWRSNFPYCYRG